MTNPKKMPNSPIPSKQKTSDQQDQEENETTVSHRDSSTKPGPIQFTVRNPQWTYLKLQLISSEGPQQSIKNKNKNVPLDSITARTYLTSALTQFLGLMGSSIGIDILKISDGGSDHVSSDQALAAGNKNQNKTDHPLLWIRVPRDDAPAVVAALSSWVGGNGSGESATGNGNVSWRICAKGNFLAAIVNGSGEDLFR